MSVQTLFKKLGSWEITIKVVLVMDRKYSESHSTDSLSWRRARCRPQGTGTTKCQHTETHWSSSSAYIGAWKPCDPADISTTNARITVHL